MHIAVWVDKPLPRDLTPDADASCYTLSIPTSWEILMEPMLGVRVYSPERYAAISVAPGSRPHGYPRFGVSTPDDVSATSGKWSCRTPFQNRLFNWAKFVVIRK